MHRIYEDHRLSFSLKADTIKKVIWYASINHEILSNQVDPKVRMLIYQCPLNKDGQKSCNPLFIQDPNVRSELTESNEQDALETYLDLLVHKLSKEASFIERNIL